MKILFAIILSLFASSAFTQNLVWGEPRPPKIRTDTTHGLIVHVAPVMGEVYHHELDTTPVFWGGYRTEVVYYTTTVSEGIRIDTVKSSFGEVPCPDNLMGCLVFHWGWTDSIIGSRYESDGDAIETKNVIHFIEK